LRRVSCWARRVPLALGALAPVHVFAFSERCHGGQIAFAVPFLDHRELGHPVDQPGHRLTEALAQVIDADIGILDHVVQDGGSNRRGVELHRRQPVGNGLADGQCRVRPTSGTLRHAPCRPDRRHR